MSKTKVKPDDIEFVHQPLLGISGAIVRSEAGVFSVAFSFSHKQGPTGKQNFEQFSRAKGRALCEGRARAVGRTSQELPYTFSFSCDEDLREVAKAVKTLLVAIQDNNESTVNSPRTEQMENGAVFQYIHDCLMLVDAEL